MMKGTKYPAIDATEARKKLALAAVGSRHGCYVFSITHYNAPEPWYVGKAAKLTFAQEVFNDSNCKKYGEAVAIKGSGKVQVYFVCLPKGPTKTESVDRLETRLIEDCAGTNPKIRNRRKITVYEFRIAGVMNAGPGAPSKAASSLRKMMGLA
jgi:hypothetical protein